ncbi:MAG: NADH-quinone oxidoreductase subunit NuoF [bacterium]
MRLARSHVLVSIDIESVASGAWEVLKRLKEEISRRGLLEEIKVLETGTLGVTGLGVVLAVYPERIYYGKVKPEDCPRIVEEHFLKGRPVQDLIIKEEVVRAVRRDLIGPMREQKRVILENSGIIDPEKIEEYLARDGYTALEKALSLTPDEVIAEVKKSGLRGRGGAGFPTGIKWEGARKASAMEKFIICNADEGEPGTFKDRLILEGDPHKLIEGLIIAGYAVGARKGYIYIRGEYALSLHRMRKAIEDARKYGLLGEDILGSGFSFNLEIKEGAGAYVCGEETALMESLEGKRGNPRIKPPYPTVVGLFGSPTVINNVETLANIPAIIRKGADWFRTMGTESCPGTKVYTILGDVNFPGLIEVEMGTTLYEIIFGYGGGIKGGKKFKAALVGGAAGVFLPESLLNVRMDFDNLKQYKAVLGSGAILVMSQEASIPKMLHSVLYFFRHESCGQCSPCRSGTRELYRVSGHLLERKGKAEDLNTMVKLSEALWYSSLCPLGQSLIMPVKSALENFREEFLPLVQ